VEARERDKKRDQITPISSSMHPQTHTPILFTSYRKEEKNQIILAKVNIG